MTSIENCERSDRSVNEDRRDSKDRKDQIVKSLKEALSGLGGNIFSSNIIFPMDVVKIRMQVPNCTYKNMFDGLFRIFNEEGLGALYTGLSSEMFKSCTQTFIYFFVYSSLKEYAKAFLIKREIQEAREKQELIIKKYQQLPILINLLVGFIAGCITQIFVNPLSVIQTRIIANKRTGGIIQTANSIIKNEGILALYKGIIPTFILCINPAIQYLVFDNLKACYTSRKPTAMENFIMGAISKVIATISTYPYIMAKVRLQYSSKSNYSGTLDVILKILLQDGFFGLFAGLQPQLLKSILSGALLLMAKEKIAKLIA